MLLCDVRDVLLQVVVVPSSRRIPIVSPTVMRSNPPRDNPNIRPIPLCLPISRLVSGAGDMEHACACGMGVGMCICMSIAFMLHHSLLHVDRHVPCHLLRYHPRDHRDATQRSLHSRYHAPCSQMYTVQQRYDCGQYADCECRW